MAESSNSFVTYKRGYVIVILLGLFNATNFYQHYEFTAITNVVSEFYEVSESAIYWTAILFNIGTVIMFYPLTTIIEKYGCQETIVMVTGLNALGPAIKCFALRRNHFGLLLFGQSFPAFVTVVMPSLAAVVGAKWFKSEHVAAVISFVTFCLNLGSAIAFLSPSIIFSGPNTKEDIFIGLSNVSVTLSVVTAAVFILSVIIVREQPPTAPSYAEHSRGDRMKHRKLRELFQNKNYLLLTLIFSMIIAISQSLTVVLNQSILVEFESEYHIVTITGLLFLTSGMLSSPVTGYVCKRCKRYKRLLIIYCIVVVITLILYVVALSSSNEMFVYIATFAVGFSYISVYVLSMDFIVEVTYPFSEAVTINITTVVAAVPTIIILPITSAFMSKYGTIAGNLVLVFVAIINVIASIFVTEDMKRSNVDNEANSLLHCIEASL